MSTGKYRHESVSFPIHFEGENLRVFTNPSKEVFIENTVSGVTMRLNANGGFIEFTSQTELVQPINVNGMIGWRIGTPRPRNIKPSFFDRED